MCQNILQSYLRLQYKLVTCNLVALQLVVYIYSFIAICCILIMQSATWAFHAQLWFSNFILCSWCRVPYIGNWMHGALDHYDSKKFPTSWGFQLSRVHEHRSNSQPSNLMSWSSYANTRWMSLNTSFISRSPLALLASFDYIQTTNSSIHLKMKSDFLNCNLIFLLFMIFLINAQRVGT